ncbi:MAG TPA: hypothetical protein VGB37_14600 [Candidatus Lokiarchaeia archaeon]
MKKELFMDKPSKLNVARFLLVKFGCPYCRNFQKSIQLINLRLPIDKRIKVVDCMYWERYGVQLEPIMKKFEKDGLNEGYPLCFLTKDGIENGITLEPSSPEMLKAYLNKFLEEEFIY